MKLPVLLFDLDGTLINSSKCILSVYTELFKELKLPLPTGKDFFTFIGPSVKETLSHYIEGDTAPYCQRFREIYKDVDFKATNFLYDGVTDMLKVLSESGYTMYVASTKNERFANIILQELNAAHYFKKIFGSMDGDGRYSKTDVLNAIFDSGENKDDCILIGDTKYDLEGAKNVGIKMGLVTYGFGDDKTIDDPSIVWRASEPKEVTLRIKETVL